jgi:hypothetical protein
MAKMKGLAGMPVPDFVRNRVYEGEREPIFTGAYLE